jgi:CheY-like chemotaxis protein
MRLTLCILEDDPAQVLAIKQSVKLSIPDCTLRLEKDGKSFLRSLSLIPTPDLIVLDINVPVMSGTEVLKKIRSRDDLAWLPIVMFSTDDSSSTRLNCLNAGANGFEVKPPILEMGKVLKAIVEKYGFKGDRPERIHPPLLQDSAPINRAEDWDMDDLFGDL